MKYATQNMKKLIVLVWLIPFLACAQGNTNRVVFSNPSNQLTGTFTGPLSGNVTAPIVKVVSNNVDTVTVTNDINGAGFTNAFNRALAASTAAAVNYYNSTNTFGTNSKTGTTNFLFTSTIPATFTRTYTLPTNGQYVGSVVFTNVTSLVGQIVDGVYIAGIANGGGPSISVHPEIYYSYDNGVTMLGDWTGSSQSIAIGSTNFYTWTIANPSMRFTNPVNIYRIMKVDAAFHANLLIAGGTNTPSGIQLEETIAVSPIPIGGIIMWSGTIATIPTGWHLCDGTGGTPDLRNRFVVAANADSGGVAKTTLTGSATQSGGSISHAHTITDPGHFHIYNAGESTISGSVISAGSDYTFVNANSFTTNTGITVNSVDAPQPYYALAYIMKL